MLFQKLDALNKKLAKAPSFLWIVLLGGSYVLRNLWDLIANMDDYLAYMNDSLSQVAVELTGFADNLAWTFYVSTAVLGAIFFELLLWFVYSYMYRRQYVAMEERRFKTAARVIFIIANSLNGVFGLLGFVDENFFYYNSYILRFVIDTGAFLLLYFVLRESVLNPRWQGTALKHLFSFYILLNGAMAAMYVIMSFTEENPLHEKIASQVSLGIIIAAGVLINRYVVKEALKKEREYIPVPRERHDDDDGDSGEIFRGYGF